MLLPIFRPDGAISELKTFAWHAFQSMRITPVPHPPFEGGGFLRCLQKDGG